ncbi:MAG: hypothetical protein GY761_10500 [Hyphomicrobiales bacterium]|nr:hypothetical protein [Hyphomicrobiales bacterium]
MSSTKLTKRKHRTLVDAPLVKHFDEAGRDMGYKEPVLEPHDGSTDISSFFASVEDQLPKYAENYTRTMNPNTKAKNVRFLAYFSTEFGFFSLRENGHYKWSAFQCIIDKKGNCKEGSVIDEELKVEKLLVQYQE